MKIDNYIKQLEEIQKELSIFQKDGLDISSLKLFINNIKIFKKVQDAQSEKQYKSLSQEDKLIIIQKFLEDKKAFPRISDVINFANNDLNLDFKDQKESRATTIGRIIIRFANSPTLQENLKRAVMNIRNQKVHNAKSKNKKDLMSAEIFSKWAEIIGKI
jgi:hypothetical protein